MCKRDLGKNARVPAAESSFPSESQPGQTFLNSACNFPHIFHNKRRREYTHGPGLLPPASHPSPSHTIFLVIIPPAQGAPPIVPIRSFFLSVLHYCNVHKSSGTLYRKSRWEKRAELYQLLYANFNFCLHWVYQLPHTEPTGTVSGKASSAS